MSNEKELELLRGLQKLRVAPIKSEDYSSPLENDTMKAKGGNLLEEPVTRIKGTTQKIDTNQIGKIVSPKDVADKVSRFRAMRALGKVIPGLGAITALGSGLMSDNASASDVTRDTLKEIPGDIPGIGQAYDLTREALGSEDSGPQTGSFDDRLQRGQLTPEEMEMLKRQYLKGN